VHGSRFLGIISLNNSNLIFDRRWRVPTCPSRANVEDLRELEWDFASKGLVNGAIASEFRNWTDAAFDGNCRKSFQLQELSGKVGIGAHAAKSPRGAAVACVIRTSNELP
jgi:hypothetical protein